MSHCTTCGHQLYRRADGVWDLAFREYDRTELCFERYEWGEPHDALLTAAVAYSLLDALLYHTRCLVVEGVSFDTAEPVWADQVTPDDECARCHRPILHPALLDLSALSAADTREEQAQ